MTSKGGFQHLLLDGGAEMQVDILRRELRLGGRSRPHGDWWTSRPGRSREIANSTGTSLAFKVWTKLKLYGAISICSCCHKVAKRAKVGADGADIRQQFAQRLERRIEIVVGAALDPVQLGNEGDAELAVQGGQPDTALVFRIPKVFPTGRRPS